jgi:hypothetical protein
VRNAPTQRLPQPKLSARRQDNIEEYLDSLVRNREDLTNVKHLSHKQVAKQQESNTRTKQSPSVTRVKATVLSKYEANYGQLQDDGGEERLKKKIYYYRKEILRMLDQVEEYVVSI